MTDLNALQQALRVSFANISLMEQALAHGSYVNENPGQLPGSNERLEFLGDAILSLVVAEKLYQDYPDYTEGELTKLRAALVRQDTLVRIAKRIELGQHLYLGKGEASSGGRSKPANLAAALEAVIGAIYLDQGLPGTRESILSLIDLELKKAIDTEAFVDYKSRLQEIIQVERQQTPSYHVIQEIGPDHDKTFTVEVRLDNTVLGRGSGKNKKTAQSNAACSALEKMANGFTP